MTFTKLHAGGSGVIGDGSSGLSCHWRWCSAGCVFEVLTSWMAGCVVRQGVEPESSRHCAKRVYYGQVSTHAAALPSWQSCHMTVRSPYVALEAQLLQTAAAARSSSCYK